jgi:phosphoribosylformimino-5-aminoimidazole carboxamide ribotide isomerase
MRIIGVIDLLAGHAVHARGGRRDAYVSIDCAAGVTIRGDAAALARLYVEDLGVDELYVADLDAIRGRATQDALIAAIAEQPVPLWVDAGITSVEQVRRILRLGAARIVVGLETLESYDDLAAICSMVGSARAALSLDLRNGVPIVAPAAAIDPDSPEQIAARAVRAGAGALIVLDLTRVGMGVGLDIALIETVRRAAPAVTLLAGGGVRDADDLARLAQVGCDAALVATALHDGRIGPRYRVSR